MAKTLKEYIEGVPWQHIKKKSILIEEGIEPALQAIREYWFNRMESEARRVRPAYRKVWQWLLDRLEGREGPERLLAELEELESAPNRWYRKVAGELGLSWRTVRDAVWAVRRVLGV